MTETKKRIKELKEALPRARERVVAVVVLLALSVSMMAVASYAWYTISVAPQISSMSTTVSSNGNLEIALAGRYDADGNLIAPDKSGGGDSFAAEGQTAGNANLTWGNLVNLSDIYGLESLTLRPATFNAESAAYLSSVVYGGDGRVEGSTSKFDFTYWTKSAGGSYSFATNTAEKFGVRAISSVAYPEPEIETKLAPARSYFGLAQDGYLKVVGNSTYIDTIESLINEYVGANISSVVSSLGSGGSGSMTEIDATFSNTDRNNLAKMLEELLNNAYKNYGEALAAMATAQLALQTSNYTIYTWDTLRVASNSDLSRLSLSTLQDFKNKYLQMESDVATMKEYVQTNTTIKWSDIEEIINRLIDINSVEIMVDANGRILTENGYTVSEIVGGAVGGYDEIMGYGKNILSNASVVPVRICAGSLADFEKWTGAYMYAGISVKASYIVSIINISGDRAKLHTKWRDAGQRALYYTEEDNTIRISGTAEYDGPKTALETYGMVIDMWVRTNAADSILTLDGTVETKSMDALKKMIPSGSSDSRQVFTYTYYTGNTITMGGISMAETVAVEMFQMPADLDGDGTISSRTYTIVLNENETYEYTVYEGYFYDSTSYDQVPLRDANGNKVQATDSDGNGIVDSEGKPVYECLTGSHFGVANVEIAPTTYSYEVVTGFSASNRVDGAYSDNANMNNMISATQGSGSCYIFYADPNQAQAAMELLQYLKVAFCDQNGNLLATGRLAVEKVVAESGKYTIPILIESSTVTYMVKTEDGGEDARFGIASLNKGEAKLISMVVYLEGSNLENSMVMEKDSVQGSLNIQFASSVALNAQDDTALSEQNIKLSAAIRDGSTHELEMTIDSENPAATTTRLTAVVEGLTPNTVQAVFRRQINASQGSSMAPVTLDASLSADVHFSMPGTYVLRSLLVDGVEYALPQSSWITVVVNGFAIDSIEFCDTVGSDVALSAESFVTSPLSVWFTNGTLVESVTARFVDDNDNVVDATLQATETSGKFSGDVRFRSSGHYTLTYLVVNGEYYEVPASMQRSFTAYLGLRAEVSLRPKTAGLGYVFPFRGAEEFVASVRILTDDDKSLKNMTGVKLQYGKRGSTLDPEGLGPQLSWDGEYYVGTLNVASAGVFNFKYLQVGGNVITKYTFAPSIAAQTTEAPKLTLLSKPLWDSGTGAEAENLLVFSDIEQTRSSNGTRDPYYRVMLTNVAGVMDFSAVFTDPDGKQRIVTIGDNLDANGADPDGYVEQTDAGVETYMVYFKLPVRLNDSNYNGDWKLNAIRLSPVYDETGKFYGPEGEGETPVAAYYTLAKEDDFSVLSALNSSFNPEKDNGVSVVTNTFMTGVATNVSVNIGWSPSLTYGSGLQVTSAVVSLSHNKSSMSSYYTVSDADYAKLTTSYTMEFVQQDGKWVAKNTDTVTVAGDYVVQSIVATVSDGTTTYTFTIKGNNQKVLTVATANPDAKFTASTPTGSFNTQVTWTTKTSCGTTTLTYSFSGNKSNTISDDKYTATVYASVAQSGGIGGAGSDARFTQPSLTITLSGMGDFSSASLVLPAANGAPAVNFNEFTPSKLSSTKSLGLVSTHKTISTTALGGTSEIQRYTGYTAANAYVKITDIAIVREGVSFTMKLAHELSICNPSSVNQS